MGLSLLQWLLIFANLVLQTTLLIVMVRGRSRSTFPVFFNFVAFCLITLLLQVILLPHASAVGFFYLYWGTMAVATVLSFGVIYEVFTHVLRPYSALVDLGRLIFKWAIVFLAFASLVTALATHGSETAKICATIQVLDRSCDLMQCGLLMILVLFESRLGLSWRSPAICIILGFGLNAAIVLTASFVTAKAPAWSHAADLTTAFVSITVYAAWLVSFALPHPVRRTVQDSPTRLILQRWNEALMATPLVMRKNQPAFAPVESFLPGVEQTVERVMARKMMH